MTFTKVLNGHVIEVASKLPDNWFHSILTSPPYWQLRDYGTPHQQWPSMQYIPIAGCKSVKVKAWVGELGQEPTIDTKAHNTPESRAKGRGLHPDSPYQDHHGTICGNRDPQRHATKLKMVGWQKSCECEADIVPCRVLDPFGGMATTGLVCERLNRECTAIELSPAYASRAETRLEEIRKEELGMFYKDQS